MNFLLLCENVFSEQAIIFTCTYAKHHWYRSSRTQIFSLSQHLPQSCFSDAFRVVSLSQVAFFSIQPASPWEPNQGLELCLADVRRILAICPNWKGQEKYIKHKRLPVAQGTVNNTMETSFPMNFKTWEMTGSMDCHFENSQRTGNMVMTYQVQII